MKKRRHSLGQGEESTPSTSIIIIACDSAAVRPSCAHRRRPMSAEVNVTGQMTKQQNRWSNQDVKSRPWPQKSWQEQEKTRQIWLQLIQSMFGRSFGMRDSKTTMRCSEKRCLGLGLRGIYGSEVEASISSLSYHCSVSFDVHPGDAARSTQRRDG